MRIEKHEIEAVGLLGLGICAGTVGSVFSVVLTFVVGAALIGGAGYVWNRFNKENPQ